MSLKNDAFPSSEAFEAISAALSNDAERKDAIKTGGAVFAFELTNDKGDKESWYLDLKESGKVGKGQPPKKADVTLALTDENFGKLVAGKSKAQTLFMSGKLKIKGNVMKGVHNAIPIPAYEMLTTELAATKLEPILAKAKTQSKL
ncbi:hypothetical protein LTR67_004480 [Exophiala xenobiotica]